MAVDRSRLPDLGADPAFTLPRIVHHTLANGIPVRTIEHHGAPVVTLVVVMEGGAGADPAGQEGLSALTADMLDEGTAHLSAIDVSDTLARIGGDYDVDVGADVTILTLTMLARFVDRGAALLSDLLARPSLRAADFDRVRQLRLDRLRQMRDVPQAMAERAFLRVVYGQHPYGHLAIGDEAALQRLSLTEVASFHQAVYRPSGATVVVAGPMRHEQLAQVAVDAFGAWTEPPAGGHAAPAAASSHVPPEAPVVRFAIVPRAGAAQSELRIGHLSARRSTPDYHALVVMNAVMGGQFVSRINLKLREEKGYTYGARTGFDWRRGMGPFVLHASVHTAATADAIRESLAELAAIRGPRPPSDSELTLAKASLTRGYPRNFETVQQVARAAAQLALFGLPDSYFEEFIPRVNAVTIENVTDVAARYLDPSKLATLIVGDHAAIRESLDELALGAPAVLS